ncbi:hypothetical protein B0T21DRAFT_197962 [Apiosordaria backusii]|uniref:Uncharacterized protein n=1 Tax=Apiosordaria backusii TaxID=314023 RepID=A0AA40EER1_9PEZI|nr:hypothetical protein B0T21DRAFT_197962 [Apiosordaria backusii]
MEEKRIQERQVGENADFLPAGCFAYCDTAYQETQRIGRQPELCEPNSVFRKIYKDCKKCLEAELVDNEGRLLLVQREYLNPNFEPWFSYCESGPAPQVTFPADYFDTLVTTKWGPVTYLSDGSATSFLTTVTQVIPNLRSFNITTTEASTLTSTEAATATTSSSTSSSATPTQSVSELEVKTDETSTSSGLTTPALVGVIVGPVVAAILLLGGIAYCIRRHRKKATATQARNDEVDESWGKAQLHGDSLPAEPKTPPQELPDSGLREAPLASDSAELPISPNSKEVQGSPGLPRYELDVEAYRERKERGVRDNMF